MVVVAEGGESALCAIQLWIFRVATGYLTPGREDFSIINGGGTGRSRRVTSRNGR